MAKSSRELRLMRSLGIPMTDIVHERIHAGEMFSSTYHTAALADDGSVDLLFQCDAEMSSHLVYIVRSGGDCEIFLYEGPTFSGAGTAVAAVNRRRVNPVASVHTVTHTPTVSDNGDLLEHQFVPGGSGFFFTPGSEGSLFKEFILAPGENYLLRAFNRAGTAQPMNVQLDWYEPISGVA